MAFRPLKSFLPTAEDVLSLDLPRLAEIVLVHAFSYETGVKQGGKVYPDHLRGTLNNVNMFLGLTLLKEPEYGARQSEVTRAVMEAWDWLVRNGMVIEDHVSKGWFRISRAGEGLLARFLRFEEFENVGLDHVKQDLLNETFVGATQRAEAREWVSRKEILALPPVEEILDNRKLPITGNLFTELPGLPKSGNRPRGSTTSTKSLASVNEGRIRKVDRGLLLIKKRVRELRSENLSYEDICRRLADSPRPPRSTWRELTWPAAYKRHTSAVTKWLSQACSCLPILTF